MLLVDVSEERQIESPLTHLSTPDNFMLLFQKTIQVPGGLAVCFQDVITDAAFGLSFYQKESRDRKASVFHLYSYSGALKPHSGFLCFNGRSGPLQAVTAYSGSEVF